MQIKMGRMKFKFEFVNEKLTFIKLQLLNKQIF